MFGDYSLAVGFAATAVTALAVGSLVAPLIPGSRFEFGTSKPPSIAAEEYVYCRASLPDVNCGCFAGVSGHILSHPVTADPRRTESDRVELARLQARQSC